MKVEPKTIYRWGERARCGFVDAGATLTLVDLDYVEPLMRWTVEEHGPSTWDAASEFWSTMEARGMGLEVER